MSYRNYIPCDALKPYIDFFVISHSENGDEHKVLPGTGLVIGFQCSGKISKVSSNTEKPLSSLGVTGLHDSYQVFRNAAGTSTILVYFKEATGQAFFRQPVHELFGESVSLDNFMLRSELLLLEEQLQEAETDVNRIYVVETFLLSRLREIKHDELVLAALSIIHKHKGDIRVKALAQQLHTSASPLEKRFRAAVGASPKKFASIVRLKHAISSFVKESSLTSLGYEAGFYDQAHFIKEFRAFTGETPEAFFRK